VTGTLLDLDHHTLKRVALQLAQINLERVNPAQWAAFRAQVADKALTHALTER
jgi:hypothetical protein